MKTNILGLLVTLVVGVILAGSLLAPVISDAQTNLGTPITKSNADVLGYSEYAQYYNTDFVMTLSEPADATSVADSTIEINDTPMTLRNSWSRHTFLDSDNVMIQINSASSTSYPFYFDVIDDGVITVYEMKKNTDATVTYSATEKTITLEFVDSSDTSQEITLDTTYCFTLSTVQDYTYINTSTQFSSMYITQKEIDNKTGGMITTWGGSITVDGTSHTIVAVSDISGTKVYTTDELDFEITADLEFVDIHLAEGTTDIYTGATPTFNIYVDGELNSTVTPSRSFIISEVSGHATAGASYALLGAIPIMVIVAILMLAVGAIAYRRAD